MASKQIRPSKFTRGGVVCANTGTACATAVVGPGRCHRSVEQTGVAWEPEEHSGVYVTTASTIYSASDQQAWV